MVEPLGHLKWRHLNKPKLIVMNGFSEMIMQAESEELNLLPDLRSSPTIIITSDYSGQHDTATYQSLSFLFTNLETLDLWETKRRRIRESILLDRRRISFKGLNDQKKKQALPYYLDAANSIPGLICTLLISKTIKSLIKIEQPIPEQYSEWRAGTFEKMTRIVCFASLILSGLSKPNQNVIWFTDEDEIAANPERLQNLTNTFSHISSQFLTHNMGSLRCGTTRSDNGSLEVEDLNAISDIVAGALCEYITARQKENLSFTTIPTNSHPNKVSEKTISIMNWLADDTQSLRRLVFVIDEDKGSYLIKRLEFTSY